VPLARLGVGIRIDREQTLDTLSNEDIDSETDFEETYPFLRAQWSQTRWVKRQNYLGLFNTEDIDLGLSVSVEGGLILRAFGNDSDAFRLSLALSKGWYAGDASLHKFSFQQVQYFGEQDETRQEMHARYQFFHWLSEVDQLDVRLTGEMTEGHSEFDNFSIGGEDGLRAYPNRFQVGDRRVLGVAEYRHVTKWAPWSLVHTAFTGFLETGRAWTEGTDADTLANVGVGLLLAPTRSSRSAVNRFDISVPLTSNEDIDSYQIFIGSQINF
jgi:hemolysin activation/secretion protein